MNSYEVSTQAITADDDGIAQDQTTAGAGSLTLNGAGVTSGAATLSPPRRVTLTSGANVSAVTFTITGTDRAGSPLSESIAGPNANTVTTTRIFATVTSVAVSAALGSNTRVGWAAECISPWIFLGNSWHDYTVGYGLEVSGTVNVDVERTMRNIIRERIAGDYASDVADVLTGKTASEQGSLSPAGVAVRLVQNSGSGNATLRIVPTHSL